MGREAYSYDGTIDLLDVVEPRISGFRFCINGERVIVVNFHVVGLEKASN